VIGIVRLSIAVACVTGEIGEEGGDVTDETVVHQMTSLPEMPIGFAGFNHCS
jgi:hypothetical protein